MTAPEPTLNELKAVARELIADTYGVSGLTNMSNGFYVTLQLLAVIWGIEKTDGETTFQEVTDDQPLRFTRRSHDFARRLLNGEPLTDERKALVSEDDETIQVLGELFKALTVHFEYYRSYPQSNKRHLQPYFGEAIHHDYASRPKRSAAQEQDGLVFERVYYRGGGTLVYEMLRTDADPERREGNATGLRQLVADANDAVGRASAVLHSADAVKPSVFEDVVDLITHSPTRDSRWVELIRAGTSRILRAPTQRARKVDYLLHWLPYCLARHLVDLAFRALDEEPSPVPVDSAAGGVIRRASQHQFVQHRNSLRMAVIHAAGQEPSSEARKRIHTQDVSGKSGGIDETLNSVGNFFATTMACVGALNHNTGLRHYTIKNALLEAIVHATIDAGHQIPFETFCTEILYRELCLVVDSASGRMTGISIWVDNEDLERNEQGLVKQLESLGLITNFSDATRMVGPQQ